MPARERPDDGLGVGQAEAVERGAGLRLQVPPADGVQASRQAGELLGQRSPVRTHTPLVGAEIVLEPGTTLRLDVDHRNPVRYLFGAILGGISIFL